MSIKARSIIEIVGGPKEYVDKAMGVVVEKLKTHKTLKVLSEHVFEAKPLEGKKPLFSAFCELDLEMKDMADLFGFCFDFMPSSIEIYEPAQLPLKIDAVNDMVNELITKLHQYDMAFKNVYAQNIMLKRKYEGEEQKEDKKTK